MSNVLKNAEKIIERFGGIRPMAKKMGVAATTVQGWKKRDAIPATRKNEVIAAANENGIEIADLLVVDGDRASGSVAPCEFNEKKEAVEEDPKPANDEKSDIMKEMAATQRKTIIGSFAMVFFILASCGSLVYLMFGSTISGVVKQGNDISQIRADINSLNNDVVDVKQIQTNIRSMIPENLQDDFNRIKNATKSLQGSVSELAGLADIMGGDIGALNNMDMDKLISRLSLLEGKVQDIGSLTGSQGLVDITNRLQDLQKIQGGDRILDNLMGEIEKAVIGGNVQDHDIGELLEQTASNSDVVGMAFGDVSGEEMKAAALLLAMNQLRGSLNRDNASFDSDMALVVKLVGQTDDPELEAAIIKLSPHAKSGVLTPQGLSSEFRTLAGEIVISSLSGEDVSIKEKAISRLNQVVKVKKNGEMITGTDTEKKVAKAQELLDAGKVNEAVALLKTLDGEAGMKAIPFIENAQNTLLAGDLKNLLSGSVMNKLAKMASGSYAKRGNGGKYINR